MQLTLAPDDELYVLMECAEGPFGLGRPLDYRWYVGRPGLSSTIDLVRDLKRRGYVTVAEKWDPRGLEMRISAEITPAGRTRINELVRDGVQPSHGRL